MGMLTQFGNEIANNLRDMADKMTTPFLVLFGEKGGVHVFYFVSELALGSRDLSQAVKKITVKRNKFTKLSWMNKESF